MSNLIQQLGKVAVLYGGLSAERDISLMSGQNVLNSLLSQGIDAYGVDVQHDVIEQLRKCRYDRACIMLHGRGGEDGEIQDLLEMLNIPYTGSDVGSSALAMDKHESKHLWQQNGLKTLPFVLLHDDIDFEAVPAHLGGFPVCIKPVHEGSSHGVERVTNVNDLKTAYKNNKLRFQDDVLAEPWLDDRREFTVTILEKETLPVVEIITPDGFYDYHAKYASDAKTVYQCPCDLSPEEANQLSAIALKAFQILHCCGWGRVDFLQDRRGCFWVMEANTVPGMTSHSLSPIAAKAIGMDFDEFVLRILKTSL